jgi:hypothetical protein
MKFLWQDYEEWVVGHLGKVNPVITEPARSRSGSGELTHLGQAATDTLDQFLATCPARHDRSGQRNVVLLLLGAAVIA